MVLWFLFHESIDDSLPKPFLEKVVFEIEKYIYKKKRKLHYFTHTHIKKKQQQKKTKKI